MVKHMSAIIFDYLLDAELNDVKRGSKSWLTCRDNAYNTMCEEIKELVEKKEKLITIDIENSKLDIDDFEEILNEDYEETYEIWQDDNDQTIYMKIKK
jgi:hypothetical protein